MLSFESLRQVGYREAVSKHLRFRLTSPNAIDRSCLHCPGMFGRQQGALRGPNPRKHGRPSHPPLVAVLAEAHFLLHGWLRSENCGTAHVFAYQLCVVVCGVRR